MHIGRVAGALLATTLVSTPLFAQSASAPAQAPPPAAAPAPPPAEAAPSKPVTLTAGVDFTNAYVFRGILQEDSGFIAQPWADVAITAYSGKGALKALTLNFGNWDSQHSGPTGKWYESDYYGSATFAFGKFKPGLLYTSYTSPNDRFHTVHELAGVFSVDDSASAFPLSPKVVLAFEVSGQADAGLKKGTYLELGVKPALKAAPKLSFLIPVKLALSLKDYYEGPTGSNTMGYLDTGLIASVPLVSGKTSWEVHGGVDVFTFGDNLKLLNHGDRVKPVGSIGLSFTY